MRRWFWPYAILAVILTILGAFGAWSMLLGTSFEGASGQIAAAQAQIGEPVMRFAVSALEMVVPFDVPGWFKQLYSVLVLVVIGGLLLSSVLGLLLLPIFYALYRSTR